MDDSPRYLLSKVIEIIEILKQKIDDLTKENQDLQVYKGYCFYCQGCEINNLGTPLQFNEWRKQNLEIEKAKE